MKKSLLILAITLFSSCMFFSCSEEEVLPSQRQTSQGDGHGDVDDDPDW